MRVLIQVVADKIEEGPASVTIRAAKWDARFSGDGDERHIEAFFAMELGAEDSGRPIEYCVRLINPDGRAVESPRIRVVLASFDPADTNPIFMVIEEFDLLLNAAGNYEFALVEFSPNGGETEHGSALFRLHRSG